MKKKKKKKKKKRSHMKNGYNGKKEEIERKQKLPETKIIRRR